MTISANSQQVFFKLRAAILDYVRGLPVRAGLAGRHRILLLGILADEIEETFLLDWKQLANQPVCTRAFVSADELDNWRHRFGSAIAGMEPMVMPLEGDSPLPIGEFDLIAALDPDLTVSARVAANLKRLLKQRGTLLLVAKTNVVGRLKEELSAAGFREVAARSDRAGTLPDSVEIDCIIARSDGRIRTSVAASAPPLLEPASSENHGSRVVSYPAKILGSSEARELLINLVEQMLQLPPGVLDTSAPFTEFGVDSIGGVVLINELNRRLSLQLKPTVLFDYATVDKLSDHIATLDPISTENAVNERPLEPVAAEEPVSAPPQRQVVPEVSSLGTISEPVRDTDVAIIGMAGRFPGAENVQQFWENLAAGKNCISRPPNDRWSLSESASSIESGVLKRGGFISGAAEFDPLFFNISGREAEVTDPQQRLFLEEAYHALEDAGYAGPSARVAKKCGVYVGVEPGDYLQALMEKRDGKENAPVFQGNADSILAARISYFLDLKGPSIAINTACSSSLVAIHLGCQSLINGECDLVLAGGVRVFASERVYSALGSMGMLSPDGQCKTFDEEADGFVLGEAVGILVLKPLRIALRDRDHIYGVIKGSATNQDGRTNGITAPSSISQTQVQLEVYERFGLNPETFGYVEAHGTGTKLGDPIEVEALTAAFRKFTSKKSFCGIGSVKTNIGHTMAAAGVCSVIKVLLSLQHAKIPASLNLRKTNPYIDFETSPFFANITAHEWPVAVGRPRRVAVSSFGFSGTNSHLVLEEAPIQKEAGRGKLKPAYVVAVSAKSVEALDRRLVQLQEWLADQGQATSLEQISFTLNVARGHFEHRAAFVVSSVQELQGALGRATIGELTGNGWRSNPNHAKQTDEVILRQLTAELIKQLPAAALQDAQAYREKLNALAALYAQGYELDFFGLHASEGNQRISLQTYPFARERYWIAVDGRIAESRDGAQKFSHQLGHPLLHRDNSTADRSEFISSFNGSEFFFNEHQIRGVKILPGVAYLEMAVAGARRLTSEPGLTLANVAWLRPLTADQAGLVSIRLNRHGSELGFEVTSGDGDLLHAEGKIIFGPAVSDRREDLAEIRARCSQTEDVARIYERCANAGLKLGPIFRTIQEIWFGADEALARLELPAEEAGETAFSLHPGLLDGAFQTVAVLGRGQGAGLPVPFAIREVRVGNLKNSGYAYIRRAVAEKDLLCFDIFLLDDLGVLQVELQGLTMRAFPGEPVDGNDEVVYVRPAWQNATLKEKTGARLEGRLLAFDYPGERLSAQIRQLCPELEVVSVNPGNRFERSGTGYSLQPDSLADLRNLLEAVAPDFVVYRWGVDTADTGVALERCVLPLFQFIRALVLQGINKPVRLLIPYVQEGNPAYAAFGGYIRTLRQERPNLQLKIVSLGAASPDEIVRELRNHDRDTEIRYHDGERQVKRLEIFTPESVSPLPLRPSGVYVITGGLGSIGRIFSRYLAETYRARLILIGRSELGKEGHTFLDTLKTFGSEAIYLQADVTVQEELASALTTGRARLGKIHGVIHAAGVIQDGFILKKEDFLTVIKPKVLGATAVDRLTAHDPLDFFALFSSIAGVFGSLGQSDYAYANSFLDEFATLRERQRSRNERSGVTVSIAWPFWRNGGMRLDGALELQKLAKVGLAALEDKQGLSIFETALRAGEPQVTVLVGKKEAIRTLVTPADPERESRPERFTASALSAEPSSALHDKTLRYLSRAFSTLVKIPESRIRPTDSFDKFGIDSIMVTEFSRTLEKDFRDLPKTLLFEHRNLAELSEYFLKYHEVRLGELLVTPDFSETVTSQPPALSGSQPTGLKPEHQVSSNSPTELSDHNQSNGRRGAAVSGANTRPVTRNVPRETDEIAIIGLSGRYPMADEMEEFWENLRTGKDCIVEIPPERWDYRLFYDPEPGKPGKTRNKWGGFLNDVDRFDAQFFNITPREAFALDPQERLFLETAWRTVEDAGYRKLALAGGRVGVFVGVMYGEYQLYGAGNVESGTVFPLSSSYASIANRVSYFFDWRGPSMAVDTMCSSSLTAIHLACESLRRGESELALAGGVNVTVHPHKDALLSPGGFAASDGRCRSFGEGGNGYVPGEGVGAVLLKPLTQAIADHDHIYGIVRVSSLNHGGKTNGYTVPSPSAQTGLILDAFAAGQLDPRTVNYVEAHGTGTALGDPIEIAGLTRAFNQQATEPIELRSCAVGSVKSNIGHLESAAGIAGVTKVLLQMQHGEIVPSLHSAKLNPNIEFAQSIFYVPQTVEAWKPLASFDGQAVRRAGVSSFGAGGANAHVIIDEYQEKRAGAAGAGPFLFVLSAKNEERLRSIAEHLAKYLARADREKVNARDVAYTLQVGREPFEERLAIVANDFADAGNQLALFLSGSASEQIYHGRVREDTLLPLLDGEEGQAFMEALVRQQKWLKLGQFWVSGGEVPWEQLYENAPAYRIPLPTYPFRGERYWAPEKLKELGKAAAVSASLTPTPAPTNEVSKSSRDLRQVDSPEVVFLQPIWQKRPKQNQVAPPPRANLLLFDEDPSLQIDIQSSYPSWSVTRVVPGVNQRSDSGFVTIDPSRGEEFRRLVRETKPEFIIYRWSDHTRVPPRDFEAGVFTLFHLCQALMDPPPKSVVRVLVCPGQGAGPTETALVGFARAVALEQPQIQIRIVETSAPNAALLDELNGSHDERHIRFENGVREVQFYQVLANVSNQSLPLRSRGVYLITGGLGGIGEVFARWLASQYSARLVLMGRSPLDDRGRSKIRQLEQLGAQVEHVQADVSSPEDVSRAIGMIKERFGELNGIIHAAGVLRDGFLLKKALPDFADVLRPKVFGTMLLDEATKDEPLDFLVLFSSTASLFGNVGQADYSYANAFLDKFASTREEKRERGQRHGQTLSINWPLWQDTGMATRAPEVLNRLEQIGLRPIPENVGIEIFTTALESGETQVAPLFGIRNKIVGLLSANQGMPGRNDTGAGPNLDRGQLVHKIETYVKSVFAEVTQLSVDQLDSDQRFDEFGVDSIVVGDFNLRVEKDLGPLPKTLLFEHANFRQLTQHLGEVFGTQFSRYFEADTAEAVARGELENHEKDSGQLAILDRSASSPPVGEDIAIIGVAGRYPQADDVRKFWQVLRAGTDCVTEIPADRWDIENFYDPDPEKAVEGKMYARWGAFLDDFDKFDALFFNIAPLEAELMDPQERLFLETAWSVLEDAGYTRRDLSRWVRQEYANNVGVFVGVTGNTYAAVAQEFGQGRAIPTTLPWSIANRVSYLFNFNGPSLPIDTACSSSLIAIHLACESIRRGECQQAIAGGVNLYLHPSRYVSLCLTRMLSKDGKCRSFGEGGTGFVPGEGVGAVFLKPLSLAVAAGDHIYGVIKATAVNHGGRTNGYTVPNPAAQADLIQSALRQGNIDPRTLTYVEAHGTGTALGDPIELAGLVKAFAGPGGETVGSEFCALGSVKTNIGHLESAAGIAGLTKVLLQFKARELAPTLHCTRINPNITLTGTPFRLQESLEAWSRRRIHDEAIPLRAGISSFGAGGANAHIIVEEFVPASVAKTDSGSPLLIVFSARNEESLCHYAERLARFLRESTESESELDSVAYTLQAGRESFEERVAFVVAERSDLIASLDRVAARNFHGVMRGRVRRERVQITAEVDGGDSDPTVIVALQEGDLETLGKSWVAGATIDWDVLWKGNPAARRISLPTYFFSRERYWIGSTARPETGPNPGVPVRHPLLQRSESASDGWIHHKRFSPDEVLLRDHEIGDQKVLPGAVSLEFAQAAAAEALANNTVQLRNIVWLRPLIATNGDLNVKLQLRREHADRVAFELIDPSGQVAMQGKALASISGDLGELNLPGLRAQCSSSITPKELYEAFANRQLRYGAGFRVLQEIRYSENEVLAELRVPADWTGTYRLHPALVDGALQSLAVIGSRGSEVEVPFSVENIQCAGALPATCFAYARMESEESGFRRFEIRLAGKDGRVLARLAGLNMRRSTPNQDETIVCRPVWVPEPVSPVPGPSGTILLFDDGSHLAAAFTEKGNSVIRVPFGQPVTGERNDIQPGAEAQEGYERLISGTEFSAIVHAWPVNTLSLEEGLERGLLSLHRLAKALIKSAKSVPWLFIHPQNEPVYEAVSGYAKSLKQEEPKLHLKLVAYDEEIKPAELIAELGDPGFEVRYRKGVREVKKLEEIVQTSPGPEPGLRQNGVYLLTGGGGGLGRIFSKHLLSKFGARLVLAGRSELPPPWFDELGDGNAVYVQADVSTSEGAARAVSEAKKRFGQLHGIIHAAGEVRDRLIRTKSEEELLTVLRPKVSGAEALDQVSVGESLDFLILFSSTAGLLGNVGQADYAYANAYLNAFARRREQLRLEGKRTGHTMAISWPFWREGGMQTTDAALKFQFDKAGLRPLDTTKGLSLFDRMTGTAEAEYAIFSGSPQRLLSQLNAQTSKPQSASTMTGNRTKASIPRAEVLEMLKELVGKVLKLDPKLIEGDADTSEYGFDSVTFTTLANEINGALGLEITPAVLFEYATLDKFTDFLSQEYGTLLEVRFGKKPAPLVEEQLPSHSTISEPQPESARRGQVSIPITSENGAMPRAADPIAIVGMSGVFPGSADLEIFWRNLEVGADLISKPGKDRWSFPATGSGTNSIIGSVEAPWGGFMPGIDKFDSLFFDISPREAELMDPQQRLFLQTVWHTLENAGYKKSDLAGTRTGLFVGVAANDYANLLAMAGVPVEAYSSTGNAHSVLANRVSFFFDWRGPSEAIDTACSSSLVAVHRALESMASGSCDLAVVGGVNALLSPAAFVAFGRAGMLSNDGRCKTFDARANGYVRGEGVGAILLKRLGQAVRDRDHIYGVIRGSAENHGGHTQGLTVPNPNAQADLLRDAFERAGIDPFTISYIEAHGTGTSLGDPIEINGLKKAFGQNNGEIPQPSCAVTSIKTNIGHLETAAGIAGIIKVLLSMRSRQIPGNLHLQKLNPYIQVGGTPFYFPDKTIPWEPLVNRENQSVPRRAGVSSFGFGGANAHVVLEEFSNEAVDLPQEFTRPELFLFTARTRERLKELASIFLVYLRSLRSNAADLPKPSIRQIAFTLQLGREPLNERLALTSADFSGLTEQLEQFVNGGSFEGCTGSAHDGKESLRLLKEMHQDDGFLESLLQGRKLDKLARLWVMGWDIPWNQLWAAEEVTRVPLPGYPFEEQRCWLPAVILASPPKAAGHRLHPLLHRNESSFKSQIYRSEFDGAEPFFRDHRIAGRTLLPGAASLELALTGASIALETSNVALKQVVWSAPIASGEGGISLKLLLHPEADGSGRFEVQNPSGQVCVSGKTVSVAPELGEKLDVIAIRSRCDHKIAVTNLYRGFAERGLEYGPAFQVIQEIWASHSEVLSTLEIPPVWSGELFRLHPALVDGAFQGLAAISGESEMALPFAVEQVVCPEALPRRCLAYARRASGANNDQRYDITLLDEEGRILASISGLRCRRPSPPRAEPFYYQPRWQESELAVTDVSSLAGPWLLFDGDAKATNALTHRVVRVIAGNGYERSGDTVTIRPEAADDYARLIQETEFSAVVHAWSFSKQALAEEQPLGVFSLHLLVQGLIRARKKGLIAFVYPAGVPAFEAVGGYAKTLRHEYPDIGLKTIGTDAPSVNFVAELQNVGLEVRYLAGRREVRTLGTAMIARDSKSYLRRGGVFLISGGAGGLGRIFAEYFIRECDARVVLVGRSDPNEAALQELKKLGENATYFAADVSSLEGASRAVHYTKNRYGSLNGVLHAAGVLRDGLIRTKTLEDFQAVLAPKLQGVRALDEATKQEELDWFVLFSSMAGLLGSAGQSDYAYANAYLDSFAYHREELRRRGERPGRTLAIDWPLWREGGMRASSDKDGGAALGLRMLERQEGWRIFEQVLAADLIQVWAGVGNEEIIRKRLFAREGDQNTRQQPTEGVQPKISPDQPAELLAHIVRQFANLLKLDERQIRPSEPLENYGFDSIMAVEFSQLLEKDFGELSKTLLFEHPTIGSLADYLTERMASVQPPAPKEDSKVDLATQANGNGISQGEDSRISDHSLRSLPLAPTDYPFVGPRRLAIQVLYYFENRLDFERLDNALRQVSRFFYPVNSRLLMDGDRAYLMAESPDAPDFTEIVVDEAISVPHQDNPASFQPFQVPFNPLQAGEKLAKFRLFQLRSGSLLSVNVSHAIADGYSYYYFLSAWAAACRAETFPLPDHARTVLTHLAAAYHEPPSDRPGQDLMEEAGLALLDSDLDPTTEKIVALTIDPERLLAEAHDSTNAETRRWITENSAITAFVWQTYARSLAQNGDLTLACPIDFRRMVPGLSMAFFGNASAPALLRLSREEVINAPIGRLAMQISESIQRCDKTTLARYSGAIDQLRNNQGLAAIDRVALVNPHKGLVVTNVARFPLPPIDFGTGAFANEYTPINYAGTGVIVSEGGAVKVRLAYPAPAQQKDNH